ncbi:MAG: NAD-dependent epimerase/dehydratase family protein [Gemmatimonadales bacterium]|jgi:dTDP-4-dehydrorhamnose reductase
MRYAHDTQAPPATEAELDALLARPTDADVAAAAAWDGDLVVLGAGGKMGPSLVRLALAAVERAGAKHRVVAVSRFGDAGVAQGLEAAGAETVACDLLDERAVRALPDASNVILMAGQKFGTVDDPATTWSLNALLPAIVARRYAGSRLVAFSTGNVYPLTDAAGEGPRESDPTGPVGEYAHSALARERILTFLSNVQRTPTAILRLNYAVELRYGVLRDIADRLVASAPIDLTMGWVNLIWQRDANAIALRALAHCAVPPLVLNVTGPKYSVRELAAGLAARLDTEPVFRGEEAGTALLSDASRCAQRFGPPTTSIETMLDWVADWVRRGGRSLGRPTHFEERKGRF